MFGFVFWPLPFRGRAFHFKSSLVPRCGLFFAIPNATIRQISLNYHFSLLPTMLVQMVVNTTMLIELKGIKMAATTGANWPVTAK